MRCVIVNPLGVGLHYYTDALASMISRDGHEVRVLQVVEPSAGTRGRVAWFAAYVRGLLSARRANADAVIVTWPPIGYWDVLIARLVAGPRTTVVIHDPEPLVRAVGYGRGAAWAAGTRRLSTCNVVTHSARAANTVRQATRRPDVAMVPHPMLAPRARERSLAPPITVRVLGQYKADRDTAALGAFAAAAPAEWRCEIWGRGWPQVHGWVVTSRFLGEAEFSHRIAEADVVLIPYTRFYQSGVAIRCLEAGVPVVGPVDSSLAELLGSDSGWLVRSGDWMGAVHYALEDTGAKVYEVALDAYEAATQGWRDWLSAFAL